MLPNVNEGMLIDDCISSDKKVKKKIITPAHLSFIKLIDVIFNTWQFNDFNIQLKIYMIVLG